MEIPSVLANWELNQFNLNNMRKFYLLCPIFQTMVEELSWSHICVMSEKKMKLYVFLFVMVSCASLAHAQIAGTVVDGKNSMPVAGVNIYLQRDSTGIGITDSIGKFEITRAEKYDEKDTIVFSHIGYLPVKYTLKGLRSLSYRIVMRTRSQELAEVTVKGEYGRVFLDYKILKSLPQGVHSFCSIMKEGKIYIVSGIEDIYVSNKMFVYDIAANTWTESSQKFIPRFCHAAVYYKGKVFIGGGKFLSTNHVVEYTEPRIEIYDMDKDTVYVDEVNPHQAADPIIFIYDNCLYVMGGTVKKNKYSNKIHVWDLKTGVWYDTGINIPKERRDNMRGVLVGDNVYFFGGNSLASMWRIRSYSLKTGEWSDLASLVERVKCPGIAVNGNLIYIYENSSLQIYNVKTNEVNACYFTEGSENSALFYADGKLYIVGGIQQDSESTIEATSVFSVDVDGIGMK